MLDGLLELALCEQKATLMEISIRAKEIILEIVSDWRSLLEGAQVY